MKALKYLAVFSILFFNNLNSFADCLINEPEKYDFSGEYGKLTTKLFFINDKGVIRDCFYIPGGVKIPVTNITSGSIDVNLKCGEDLWLITSNRLAKPTENKFSGYGITSRYRNEKVSLIAKGKYYETENLGTNNCPGLWQHDNQNKKTGIKSGECDFIKTKIECNLNSMIEDTVITFKVKNIDKIFSIGKKTITSIEL